VTASLADHEIWHVLIASDDMKRMNVEQLDDAFRLSLVDASTMVWKAGMKTWQSLGAVAGIDDEPETIVRPLAPPPPPRPMGRPVPRPPSRAPAPATFHTAVTPVFSPPTLLAPVAPVFTPALYAPDPYALPKRRAAIVSDVDFRRSSGGVHWGRWLIAFMLITGGVLAAYRQNVLRDGARRLGLENKYLNAERRVTAFVSAKAPGQLKNVLTNLALLPGPNALRESTPVVRTPEPTPVVAAAAAPAIEPTKPSAAAKAEPEVKTVSLDSLPLLTTEPAPSKAAPSKAAPAAIVPAKRARTAVAKAEPKPVAKAVKQAPRAEEPEPVAKAEPKPEPKPKAAPPPPANENPLKAAIRLAIAADEAKAAKKK
jgi:hypothetical protein